MTGRARKGSGGNIGDMTTPMYLDLSGAAKVAGVHYRTMRNYHHIAERNRRLAEEHADPSFVKPGDLPKPDNTFGRSPVWLPATIEQWLQSRPGRGVGGGRPVGWSPKKEKEEPDEGGQGDDRDDR